MSDNASTYVAASKELNDLLKSPELTHELAEKGIQWKFIPKRAPWMGGFWERLVGIVKTTLKKVLGNARITYTELITIVSEVEAMINDRPLTFVSSNINDLDPLTPSKLMYGHKLTCLPHACIDDTELLDPDYPRQSTIVTREKTVALTVQRMQRRWRDEYLTSLRERYSDEKQNKEVVSVGDVVHIHDDRPRVNWKIGLVTELHRGPDGLVRSVGLRTKTGLTNRPIRKLVPLEITAEIEKPTILQPTNVVPARRRSSRKAAQIARDNIRKMYLDSDSESYSD